MTMSNKISASTCCDRKSQVASAQDLKF